MRHTRTHLTTCPLVVQNDTQNRLRLVIVPKSDIRHSTVTYFHSIRCISYAPRVNVARKSVQSFAENFVRRQTPQIIFTDIHLRQNTRTEQNDDDQYHHNQYDPTLLLPNLLLIFYGLVHLNIRFLHIIRRRSYLIFDLI